MMNMSFIQAQSLSAQAHGMNAEESTALLALLMSGELAAAEGAELLVTMAERGETAIELAAWVTALRQQAVSCDFSQGCLDVCGTGGSGLSRFNVSTTVAFICAAHGIPVAKHGNRGSLRPNGAFDLLDALGIVFDLSAAQLKILLERSGVCFLFARTMHPAVAKVVPYRKAAGRRSIFNLAGPLANPAHISHQIIGCINERTAEVLAEALQILGTQHACVVWGAPGIDEFSVTGPSNYYTLQSAQLEKHSSQHAMHPQLDHQTLPGGDAEENASIFLDLIHGRERGPLRDMVLVNAGAAIDVWNDRSIDLGGSGYTRAAELLDSGKVLETFEEHKRIASSL